ncbi:two pore domain potassium channel family protein [Candidatus Micrarchaeota archaeon]|nr:two pore domain potassium channel family protein [Candidatus Micrarchaeota archaeon]
MPTKPTVKIAYVAATVLLLLLIGAIVFHQLENWSFIDALYFSSATLTTVGYGDIVPKTDAAKVFAIFYMFFGISVVLYSLGIIGEYYVRTKMENSIAYKKMTNIIDELETSKKAAATRKLLLGHLKIKTRKKN